MKKGLLFILLVSLFVQDSAAGIVSRDGRYLYCFASKTLNSFWQDYVNTGFIKDVTGDLDDLGVPYGEIYVGGEQHYARNPWDLKAFNGKLYLGAGNSSNKGPAINAGPVEIIYFDSISERFVKEARVDEEQIDLYREFNGRLYIPGHDSTQSWKLGNYYRNSRGGEWEKNRNIPGALHVYDLAWHGPMMFAALGTRKGAAVAMSKDDGQSWKVQNIGKNRVYSFLKVKSKLYAIKRIPTKEQIIRKEKLFGIAELRQPDNFIPRYDLKASDIFPSSYFLENKQRKIVRSLQYGDKTIYIGAYVHNDHQNFPFGLFAASSFDEDHLEVNRVCLPIKYRPWDLRVYDGYLYILVEQVDIKKDRTIIKVLRSKGDVLSVWEEYFQFSAPTFARSFEILDGDFYFGLGTEVNNPNKWTPKELSPSTGKILRLRGSALTSH